MVYGNCKQGATESYSDCTQEKKKLRALQYLNIVISQWDQLKLVSNWEQSMIYT